MSNDPKIPPAQVPSSPVPASEDMADFDLSLLEPSTGNKLPPTRRPRGTPTLALVETAFLASTTALIWLFNFYFPIGPVLRIFFGIPIALAFMRWNRRTAWMTALVASLLLSVFLGPPRSLQFLMPHGFLGVLLGGFWKRKANWWVSIGWGSLLTGVGLLFQVGLLSVLLGDNLWLYVNQQVTGLVDWIFANLGILTEVNLVVVQSVALMIIFLNAAIYNLVVHLAAWLLFERLGTPIPPPPEWLQSLLRE
jgi:uncharacterized protein YybS (DUF2232 family)